MCLLLELTFREPQPQLFLITSRLLEGSSDKMRLFANSYAGPTYRRKFSERPCFLCVQKKGDVYVCERVVKVAAKKTSPLHFFSTTPKPPSRTLFRDWGIFACFHRSGDQWLVLIVRRESVVAGSQLLKRSSPHIKTTARNGIHDSAPTTHFIYIT